MRGLTYKGEHNPELRSGFFVNIGEDGMGSMRDLLSSIKRDQAEM
jgi:hypothetical protein